MTVCAASIFSWNYGDVGGPVDGGPAIIAISDRMQTDLGLRIQYEGTLQKRVWLAPSTLALVSGGIGYHTGLIQRAGKSIAEKKLTNPDLIAEEFAAQWRLYMADSAEAKLLAPLKLTMETFLERQKVMDTELVRDLNRGLLDYANNVDFEALVVGVSDQQPTISSIDRFGMVTPHADTGFAAIGIGDSHAAAHFMQSEFSRSDAFFTALWRVYCAKRRAEAAPGIGKTHDIIVVNRKGWFDVHPAIIDLMAKNYENNQRERREQNERSIQSISESGIPLWEERSGEVEHDNKNEPAPETQEVRGNGEGGAANAP